MAEANPSVLRRKTTWTDKHRHVMRKLVLEVGWVGKRLYDIVRSDEQKCRGCQKGGTEKHTDCITCLPRKEVRKLDPRKTGQMRAQTSKKDWKRQRGVTSYPLDEGPWKRCHLTVRRWESEKHKSWGIPIEGFGDHVAAERVRLVSGSAGSRRGDGADAWNARNGVTTHL